MTTARSTIVDTASKGPKSWGGHLIFGLTTTIALTLGVVLGSTVFANDAASSDSVAGSAVKATPAPDRTFILVGSQAEREATEMPFMSYHWEHYVVLVAGTADEVANVPQAISQSISGLNGPELNIKVVDYRN